MFIVLLCAHVYMFVYLYAFSCLCGSPDFFPRAYPGPFNSTLRTEMALNQIAEHRSQLEALKEEESTILHELGFFKMEQPPSKSLQSLEKV